MLQDSDLRPAIRGQSGWSTWVKLYKEAKWIPETESTDWTKPRSFQSLRGTPLEAQADAYLIPSLEMAAHEDHGWLGSNPANIDSLIFELQSDDDMTVD